MFSATALTVGRTEPNLTNLPKQFAMHGSCGKKAILEARKFHGFDATRKEKLWQVKNKWAMQRNRFKHNGFMTASMRITSVQIVGKGSILGKIPVFQTSVQTAVLI
jgi:hypothetical protein